MNRYGVLFLSFFKIGLFNFGGGYAMLPLIADTVVPAGWLTLERLYEYVAVSEMTPGPFAVNLATFVGWSRGGLFGGMLATFGVLLPSFVIVLCIAGAYERFRESGPVQAALAGMRPASVGLIAAAGLLLAKAAFFPEEASGLRELAMGFEWKGLPVLAVLSAVQLKWKVNPMVMIGLSAGLGVLMYVLGF